MEVGAIILLVIVGFEVGHRLICAIASIFVKVIDTILEEENEHP